MKAAFLQLCIWSVLSVISVHSTPLPSTFVARQLGLDRLDGLVQRVTTMEAILMDTVDKLQKIIHQTDSTITKINNLSSQLTDTKGTLKSLPVKLLKK